LADQQGFFDSNYHKRSTGSSARELLTDTVFKSMRIEIQYMKGAKPEEETIKKLKTFLNKHLHKPKGITITTTEIPSMQDSVFSLSDIMAIEDTYRTQFTTQNDIAVYILFTNGYYIKHEMLGYAYRNTSAVLFGSHIKENSDLFKKPSRTYLETRVLQHEFGHLLGLVNTGSAVQSEHHDDAHGKHCTNRNCLMYHLTDTEDYPSVLIKPELPGFDKACLKDLKANGGR
jgi:predicted Zn-dependent protease